jgi:hypothetical protein
MPYGFKTRALTFLDSLLMPPDFNTSIPVNPAEKKVLNLTIYPNPTSEIMHIEFEIPNPSPVRIQVFNAMGGMVADLSDGILAKGKHQITWNAADLPAGLYFVRLNAGKDVAGAKLVKQ